MALFENYEGRMPQLQPVLDKYGFKDFDEVKAFTNGKGVDAYSIVELSPTARASMRIPSWKAPSPSALRT